MKSSSRSVTSIVILGLVLESAVPGARVYGQANPAGNFSFPGADPAVMNMQLIAANVQTAMAACAQKSQVSRVSAIADKSGAVGSLAGMAFKESRKDSSKDLLAGLTETKPPGLAMMLLQPEQPMPRGFASLIRRRFLRSQASK